MARAFSQHRQETVFVIVIFALALAIIGGGSAARAQEPARRTRRSRRGAGLGSAVAVALWALWVCEVHAAVSLGLLGIFLIAVCTTVFYAALFWAIYLALEPFVRRYWPQTLVSWTTLLSGRVRDPIVGRDVLLGTALGVVIALLITPDKPADNDPHPGRGPSCCSACAARSARS